MNGTKYNSELMQQMVVYENTRSGYEMPGGRQSVRCIREISLPDSHVVRLVEHIKPQENGLLCEVRFPVTSMRRLTEILHFGARLYEHLPVGGMHIIPSKYLACVSFEMGLLLDDEDECDVCDRLEQMIDYSERVMNCIAEPLLDVICGGDPHEAAERCIPSLPAWTADFMPVSPMDMR